MDRNARIYVAGHGGLVGSALVRRLTSAGFRNLLLRSHGELDLLSQQTVQDFFEGERPEYVFMAAARVGGIHANAVYPADFISENLMMETNVIRESWRTGVKKLLFLGSSCIYPKFAPQPIPEDALLSGPLEPTNDCYALAKIAGIRMCQAYNQQYGTNFISVMPTNLYGPGDNFGLENSHVLPAMIRKVHEAKVKGAESVTLWGTGTPRREFLHVDDLADACLFLMERHDGSRIVNVGTGEDLTIRELAGKVCSVVGYAGRVLWDESRPDGTPRKLLDVTFLRGMGWRHTIDLDEGIRRTYQAFLKGGVRDV